MNEVLEVLTSGGAVMVATKLIILAGSIAAVIIGVERALFLRAYANKARELHEQIVRALLRGDAAIALHECDRSHVATAALYRAAFDRAQRPDRVADAVDRSRREVIQALRAPLWVLGTLGAVMPFVGLFGTVVGILGSFRQIGMTGQSGFAVVAPAISEALITTAGGIAVAVEAVILFNIFQARIAKEAFDLTLRADELTEVVIDHAADVSAALQAPRPSGAPQPTAAAVAQGHA
ncbi:MAG: MotA/TolQ/ExbB proton channel family protein [Myxococcales bacterium]